MKIKEGQHIIDFSVKDVYDNEVSTENLRGKKLLISFYRYAECIFCNLRVHDLMKRHDEFQIKGLNIIAFFQSSKKHIFDHVGKQQPPFPIIPDKERKVYKMYGVQEYSTFGFPIGVMRVNKVLKALSLGYPIKTGEGSKTLIPADFLVNEDGKIVKAFYGNDITEHIPIKEIEKFLEN